MCNKRDNIKQSGFTLVEMAIVLAIIGLLVGGALSFFRPLDQNIRTAETKERMQKVANAMSSFALRNNRIPCPASPDDASPEPFGAELGSGTDGQSQGSCTVAQAEGIVPFRTLGIRQEDVIDGYGSYFTYRVSPAFTNQNGGGNTIHDSCRSDNWINGGSNVSPDKARFCCPSTFYFAINTDLVVDDVGGTAISPTRTSDQGNMDSVDATPGNALTAVYILISHGSNRYGKFLVGSTIDPTAKFTQTDLFGISETENMNGDVNFVDTIEVLREGNTYFDDIVLWRTQDSLMSELGTNTCALP